MSDASFSCPLFICVESRIGRGVSDVTSQDATANALIV